MDAARAMLERGDWLVPHYQARPFFDKPALTYWLMAGSFQLLGFDLAAARLVPALGALLAIAATGRLGRLLFDRESARAGTLVLGMVLRRTAFDKGTAPSFVVVATLFLGLFLLGWRLVARWVTGRRTATQGA